MGSPSRNLKMRVFLTVLFCGAALALPNGRSLRPEEHWRPAAARDLSKFTPRHALVNAKSSPAENSFVQLARASPATRPAMLTCRPLVVLRDLPQRTELSEDSRLRRTSGPGRWLSSLTTPGSVVAPSSLRTTS